METKIVKSSAGDFAVMTKKWWRPWWMFYEVCIGVECWGKVTFPTLKEAEVFEAKVKENRVYITWEDADKNGETK